MVRDSNDLRVDPITLSQPSRRPDFITLTRDNRPTRTRIGLRIPKWYHQEPVISRLVSHYNLTVNIAAALLGTNVQNEGWFDLELQGTTQQIHSALIYLFELDLEVWLESNPADDW